MSNNINSNKVELSHSKKIDFISDLEISEIILSRKEPKVAIFGGGHLSKDAPYCKEAQRLAELIAKSGISIMTGGGPGIMAAANLGAKNYESVFSKSYGIRVKSIEYKEFQNNDYLSDGCDFCFETLTVRLLTLIELSSSVIFFPGGFGTLEEMFSLLVRIKVGLINQVPIYLYGKQFWNGLVSWMDEVVKKEGMIFQENLQCFKIFDDVEEIAQEIMNHCKSGKRS